MVASVLSGVAVVVAAVLLVPVLVVCVECLAAVLTPDRKRSADDETSDRPRVAVVIPAHNEEAGLAGTLDSIVPQLRRGDRVLVVADNCTDATADVARQFPRVQVIERTDPVNRGKGYALDRGIRELEQDPPDVVVMVDADCHVGDGAIDALAHQAVRTGRPAQAAYVMQCAGDVGPRACVSALAFIVKNVVRPLGLGRLGLPCLLTGTGMAFLWETIRQAHLASGNIVEDMQLGIDLALAGHAPLPCPEARVAGTIERESNVAITQRRRWEHGHLATLLTGVPRLLMAGLADRNPRLLGLALEVAVPPTALLVLMLIAGGVGATVWWRLGGPVVPAEMLAGGLALLVASALLAWARFARDVIPPRTLAAIPVYVAWKVPLYLGFLFHREKQWVRTFRGSGDPAAGGLLRPARS